MGIIVKRPVRVVVIVTEQFKMRRGAEIRAALAKLDVVGKRLDFTLSSMEKAPESGAAVGERIRTEQRRNEQARIALKRELEKISGLEIGSEYSWGTIEGSVEVEIGDDFSKLGACEIVVKRRQDHRDTGRLMPRTERDIVIGKVVAPVGIRGEVRVFPLTDFPERFEPGTELSMRLEKGETRKVLIETSREHRGAFVLKLRGVDTRNDAEDLRGSEFIIDADNLGELSEDSFYLFDIIGLKVVTEDGRDLGEVTEVLQGGANDVYVTSINLCIPALKDVVARIDVAEGVMVVRPVPGLLAED